MGGGSRARRRLAGSSLLTTHHLSLALHPNPTPPCRHAQQEAVRLAPSNADAHTGLGACLREVGRHSEAEQELEVVARLHPGCALALGNLAGVYYDQVGVTVGGGMGGWLGG